MKTRLLTKYLLRYLVTTLFFLFTLNLSGCGFENNVSFQTTEGECADGVTNAPYCISVTIQNNSGGQNYINSTSYPISDLSLSISDITNIGYPTSPGSSYDPNNCLGAPISPGQSCKFYLWLNGESLPVGVRKPITISANYTVDDSIIGDSNDTASASTTIYEVPELLISTQNGYIQEYNDFGFISPYYAESEPLANSVVNDNYYGFLYLAGNNGVYYSGNGTYVGNATATSSNIKGATNILMYGQTLYGVPNGSLGVSIYSAEVANESYEWSQYATGLPKIASNINAINGSRIFFTQEMYPGVYLCNPNTSDGNNCNVEGNGVPNALAINVLGFTTLGSANGSILTGLIAGADNGLWVESGVLGSSTNKWMQVQLANGSVIGNMILAIATDINYNIYIVDSNGFFYKLAVNSGNLASKYDWNLFGAKVASMVVDNGGQLLYAITTAGVLYACPLSGGIECEKIGSSNFSNNILSINIITQLSSD